MREWVAVNFQWWITEFDRLHWENSRTWSAVCISTVACERDFFSLVDQSTFLLRNKYTCVSTTGIHWMYWRYPILVTWRVTRNSRLWDHATLHEFLAVFCLSCQPSLLVFHLLHSFPMARTSGTLKLWKQTPSTNRTKAHPAELANATDAHMLHLYRKNSKQHASHLIPHNTDWL
jgi:hypothetical protein